MPPTRFMDECISLPVICSLLEIARISLCHLEGFVRRDTFVKAEPGESPNDRNDRAIRVAAAWYARKLPSMPVLLITNDADNLRRAKAEGLNAMGIQVRHPHPPRAPFSPLSVRLVTYKACSPWDTSPGNDQYCYPKADL